jgi:EmrB/QacA subfamily drug resistance transporter
MEEIVGGNKNKWLVLISVGMGVFLATIDGSIVNIALNTLVRDLHQPLAVIEWVVLAYMLTICTLLISAGKLGDMLGKKRLYLAGMIIFTIGSTLCGLSPSVYWLIGFRVLQAIGASFVMALSMALVTDVFPSTERGKALGIMGTLVSVGIITGPTIGGLILGALSWHWLFFVNIPVGIAGVIMVVRFVPDDRKRSTQRFDLTGAAIFFICMVSLLGALSLGQQNGFGHPVVAILLGVFAVAFVLFILVERKTPEPMIHLEMFKNRLFSINLITGILSFIVGAGTMLILPLYLQNILLYSPEQTGLMIAITPLTVAVIAPLAGSLSDRFGSRAITTLGLFILLGGYIFASSLSADTPTLGYLLRFIPVGIGLGMFQSPNNSAVMGSVSRDRTGVASSLLSLSRTIGQTTGIAILGAFWESRARALSEGQAFQDITSAPIDAQVKGLQQTLYLDVFLLSVALALSAWALIYWLRQRKLDKVQNPSSPG